MQLQHRGFIAISRSNWTSYRIKSRDRKSRAVGISLSLPLEFGRRKRIQGDRDRRRRLRRRGDGDGEGSYWSTTHRNGIPVDKGAAPAERLTRWLTRICTRVSDPFLAPRSFPAVVQIELKARARFSFDLRVTKRSNDVRNNAACLRIDRQIDQKLV